MMMAQCVQVVDASKPKWTKHFFLEMTCKSCLKYKIVAFEFMAKDMDTHTHTFTIIAIVQ